MSKKSILPSLASLLEVLPKATPPKENSNLEFDRIATALERIATALETLAAQEEPPSQDDADYWITLPDVDPATYPEKPAPPAPAKTTPKPNSVIVTPPGVVTPIVNQLPSPGSSLHSTLNGAVATMPFVKEAVLASPTITLPPQKGSVLSQQLVSLGVKLLLPEAPSVKLPPKEQSYQDTLGNLSQHLGENFAYCKELYEEIKKRASSADYTHFKYPLTQADKSLEAVKKFCSLLMKAGLLEGYNPHSTSGSVLTIRITDKDPTYLTGFWLERYIKLEVKRICKPRDILANCKISKGSVIAELDLLFVIGERLVCVEAKTNPFQPGLEGQLNTLKSFGFEEANILLITPYLTRQEQLKLNQVLGNIQAVTVNNLEQFLINLSKATPQ